MKSFNDYLKEMDYPCYWDSNRICAEGFQCGNCKYQLPDDDKPNGKAEPQDILWNQDCSGNSYPYCPACGEMLCSLDRCFFCGQRIIKDALAEEWDKPPEVVEYDCIFCGGKGTMRGTRARSNGHFHGCCENCGTVIME